MNPLTPLGLSALTWTVGLGVGLVLVAVAKLGLLAWPRRRFLLGVGVLGVALTVATSIALDHAADARALWRTLDGAALRVSPADNAPVVATLVPDETVRLVGTAHGGYLDVQCADGTRGWLSENRATPLVPWE